MSVKASAKTVCRNPNTGGTINIDSATYALFSNAISNALQQQSPLTFTELVQAVEEEFRQQKIVFKGAVAWYTITVKNDWHSRGILDVFTQNGKKPHRLSK